MAATGINHVTVPTRDLDESEGFYAHLFEAPRLDSPNFSTPVRWLRIGDVQLHLREDAAGGGGAGHFGITVGDLATVFERARELGALDSAFNGHYLWELPGGVAQLYIRDPSGNLVEVNARDTSRLPEALRAELRVLADTRPQTEQNLRARLLA